MGPVDEIKSRLDIVEFIRGYLKVEKAGQNWKALCPFHTEKTPSFMISPSRQMWYCFGCHKGGDAFKFVMELEHLEFPEALKLLAEKTGVELKREDPSIRHERNRLLELLEAAAKFFEEHLKNYPDAKNYLLSRGLAEATIQEFRLGFAPAAWDNLLKHLTSVRFSASEIEKAGLAISRSQQGGGGSGHYDRFRSRIMFPLLDIQGRVVGFTGRIFEVLTPAPGGIGTPTPDASGRDVGAKYVNTSESPVFVKSRLLYGFDKTKHEIRKENAAVLTEGQMDFLMAWQDGVKNIVATSGTALTPWHLSHLKRLCENLCFAFDMDEAGSQATERGVAMASREGFSVKIASLRAGKDIADFVKENPGKLPEVIGRALPVMEYYFDKAFANAASNLNGQSAGHEELRVKKMIIGYLLPRLKTLKSPVDQAFWLERLARRVGVAEEVLAKEAKNVPALDAAEYGAGPAIETEITPQKGRHELVAERALALALKLPDGRGQIASFATYFPLHLQALARGEEGTADIRNTLGLQGDFIATLLEGTTVEAELVKTLHELKKEYVRKSLFGLSRQIEAAEAKGDREGAESLGQEFAKLSRELTA